MWHPPSRADCQTSVPVTSARSLGKHAVGLFFGTYSHTFRNDSQYAAKLLISEDPEGMKKHCSAKLGLNLGGGITGGYGADFQSMVARSEGGRPVQEMSIQPQEEKTVSMNSSVAFVTGGFRLMDGQFKVFWKNRACPHDNTTIILDKHFVDVNADVYPSMEAAAVGCALPQQAIEPMAPPLPKTIPDPMSMPMTTSIPSGMFPLLSQYQLKSSDGNIYAVGFVAVAVGAGVDSAGAPFPPGSVMVHYPKGQTGAFKVVHAQRMALDLLPGGPPGMPMPAAPPNLPAGADMNGSPFSPGSMLVEYVKTIPVAKVVHPERVGLDLVMLP